MACSTALREEISSTFVRRIVRESPNVPTSCRHAKTRFNLKSQFTRSTCTNLHVLGTLSQWRSLSRTSAERKDFHERKILLVPEGNQIDDECCWIVDNSQEQIYCLDFEGCNLPDPIFVPTLRQNEFSPFKCPLGLKLCADRQTCSFIRHQVSILQRINA